MSTVLKNITINSFKGIDEHFPAIVDFTGTDNNIVYLKGDQGEGKTSTLEGIMWLMGHAFGVQMKVEEMFHKRGENINNRTLTDPINEEMLFEHNGVQYKSIASGKDIKVKALREGDKKDKWVDQPSPKDLLQTIFKKCIVKNELRYKSPEEQVEWVSSLFPLPKEYKNALADMEANVQNMRKVTRPAIGNKVKEFKAILESNPLYAEYNERGEELEKEIKKLEKTQSKTDIKDVSDRYQKHQQYIQRLDELKSTKAVQEEAISDIQKQINDLQIKLKLKESELKTTNEKIEVGTKIIEDTKKVVSEYEKAMKLQEESAANTLRISNFKSLQETLVKYNEQSDEYVKIDGLITQAIDQIKSFRKDFIQGIPDDIEIVTVQEMEDNVVTKEVGVYHNGINLRTLSGSEFITTVIKIIRASGSRYVFIDDLATFGSDTIAYINQLAEEIKPEGGIVFAAEMQRGSELIISLEDHIS